MFTKEQLLCIIAALKTRKCNVEIRAAHYADKLAYCCESDKREWLNRVKGEYMRKIITIDDILKSAESAIQAEADLCREINRGDDNAET